MYLAKFSVNHQTYGIYGEFQLVSAKEFDLFADDCSMWNYQFPEFYDVTATLFDNGEEKSFTPSGESFHGHSYTAEDMICSFLSALIRMDDSFTLLFLHPDLQRIVYNMREDNIKVNDERFPKRILATDASTLYQLTLITDSFCYYVYDEDVIMLSTPTREIISDNYFAGIGLLDSIEEIENKKELLLWGELPDSCLS